MRTIPRQEGKSALLVGMDEKIADTCTIILRALSFSVRRAAHIAAACERIPVLQPSVVVLPIASKPAATEAFHDCVVAVGASIVWIDEGVDHKELIHTLAAAVASAPER